MQSCELVTLISTVACILAENYSDEEHAIMAAAFTQLGDSLATILATK